MTRLCTGLFALTSVLLAQLDSNSVTITATRSVYLQPDQAVFGVSVTAPVDATLDQVVTALQGSGITAANLSNSAIAPTQSLWLFSLPVGLSAVKSTIASLTGLQNTVAQRHNGFNLNFSVRNTQVSTRLQESQQCATEDLVSDARAQAQRLAIAAGLTLGPILALSDGPSLPIAAVRSGSFATFLLGVPSPVEGTIIDPSTTTTAVFTTTLPTFSSPALNCFLTVKFALLRYQ